MEEQMMNSLHPVRKYVLAGYPRSVIRILFGTATWDMSGYGRVSEARPLSNRAYNKHYLTFKQGVMYLSPTL